MRTFCAVAAIVILVVSVHSEVRGGDPKKKSDWIPLPQVVPQPPVIIVPDLARPGTRDVWQYYGVDSFGRFRPRVILAPEGAYDSRTLEPYPWTNNRSTAFMPWVLGAPAGSIERRETPFVVPVPAPFMPYTVD